jgi:rRNA maturation endonuclease Nob1
MTNDDIRKKILRLESAQTRIGQQIRDLQAVCTHPGITKQQPHEICSNCGKEFMTHWQQIPRIARLAVATAA